MPKVSVEDTEEQSNCVHHWIIPENDKAVRLSKEVKNKHPNCLGRKATCKKCQKDTVLLERVWENNS